MTGIESEEGKREQLRRDGVTKLTAHLLLSPDLVEDPDSALKFAETIGAFAESPLDVEMERRNEVEASLETEGGKLHMSFRPDSFRLSFRDKTGGKASYDANSPVQKVQLRGPFLLFKLRDNSTVRAVKENGTISIEHFDFGLYDLK